MRKAVREESEDKVREESGDKVKGSGIKVHIKIPQPPITPSKTGRDELDDSTPVGEQPRNKHCRESRMALSGPLFTLCLQM